jgi:hypothetical protein
MNRQEYYNNRRVFSPTELAKHRAQWVAFSLDGKRLIAGAATLEALEEEIAARGENPQRAVLEYIPGPEDDISLGGAETLGCCASPTRTNS